MPTRILREGIITSQRVNALSVKAELFYRRLMSVVDDYGRFHANFQLLRSACYPLLTDDYPVVVIEGLLCECQDQQLVIVYEVDGKRVLQIENFGQQLRSKSKFPPPPGTIEESKEGKVYFIQAKKSRRIKIGYTEWRPESRLSTLQIGSAEQLVLIGWIPGSISTERDLHKKFATHASGGEWFTECDEILDYIRVRVIDVASRSCTLVGVGDVVEDVVEVGPQPTARRLIENFTPPDLPESQKFASEIELGRDEAEKFFYYYQSKGWMVGKNKMKCWKSAMRGWKSRNTQGAFSPPNGQQSANDISHLPLHLQAL